MASDSRNLIALPAGFRLGEYRIERYLGSGGFGITYAAIDENLNRRVAIKEYLPKALAMRDADARVTFATAADEADFRWGLDRFLDEARALARFDHPNIVSVERFIEAHGTGYIVMEHVDGESLSEMLRRKPTLTEAEIHEHVLPVAAGLAEVHRAGLLHRDIKPSNIVVRANGVPVLIDFGSARHEASAKSRSLTAVITPGYAPLEQYSSSLGDERPATDIYAFGAVLYRCVTGDSPPDATDRALEDRLMPAAEAADGIYSPGLLTAIDVALRMRTDERPRDIAALLELVSTGDVRPDRPEDDAREEEPQEAELEGGAGGSPPQAQSRLPSTHTGFKDPTRLSRWTAGFLYAEMIISVLAIGSGYLEFQFLRDVGTGGYATDEALIAAASASDTRQMIVGLFQFGIVMTSAVLVLMWIHRAAFNVRQLGATGLRFKPGWCVGWYFIPIANFWKPYQAMKEIWRATTDPANWRDQRRSALLPWWWLFWLLYVFAGQAAFRTVFRAEELNELLVANVAMQVSDLLTLPVCLVFLVIMRRVLALQTAHAERIRPAPADREKAAQSSRWEIGVLGVMIAVIVGGLVFAVLRDLSGGEGPAPAVTSERPSLGEPPRSALPVAQPEPLDPLPLSSFTVEVEPPHARVRVMNIVPVYEPGIMLAAGSYTVEVSAPGYETVTEAVRHDITTPTVHRVELQLSFGELAINATTRGSLESGDLTQDDGRFRDLWRVQVPEGRAGQTLTVAMSSSDFRAFLVVLTGRDFEVVGAESAGDSSKDTAARISVDVTQQGGDYVALASSHFDGQVGAYELRVDVSSPAPSASLAEGGKDSPRSPTFTRGSHEDDVLRLQGAPTAINVYSASETWSYGLSSVEISKRSRRVTQWNNLSGNLKVRMEPGPNATSSVAFTRGSHEDDVLRLQGAPTAINVYSASETWSYGLSSVEISKRSRRVTQWNNLSGNLKVRMEPGPNATSSVAFTRGSHEDDVLRLQGTPTAINVYSASETWSYGLSSVEISKRSRRVMQWNNLSGNLNVR